MARVVNRFPPAAALAAIALGMATGAQAHLGGGVESVARDRAALGAGGGSSAVGANLRHVLSLQNAGELREYSDAKGRVFAVSWDTVGRPNLRQLLGPKLFAAYQARADGAPRRRGRRRLAMGGRVDDLVVQAFGAPGSFSGFAYEPSLLPTGFTAADLK